MILCDRSIRQFLARGRLVVQPEPEDIQFQPCSLDVRLGSSIEVNGERFHLRDTGRVTLYPGDSALAVTHEMVALPEDLAARVEGRSTFARKFLMVEQAGWIDPGFRGQIVLELGVLGKRPVELEYLCRIAQLVFIPTDAVCERPYGSEGLGSKYQGQVGVVGARKDEST